MTKWIPLNSKQSRETLIEDSEMQYPEIIDTMTKFLIEEPTKDFQLLDGHNQLCRYNYLSEYELKAMAKVANGFDTTGKLTLVYLASLCRDQIDNTMMPVSYALNNTPSFDIYRKCLECINSDIVQTSRKEMVENLAKLIGSVSSKKVIGSNKQIDESLDDALAAIFQEFPKLKFEVYANSGLPVGTITNTSCSVQVCGSLAEFLIRLEKSKDGIYIGFISNPGTLDGWFGYFVKSNGNMFSYNERIDEAYSGQHRNMRNGRYAEHGKAYDLFPYELCEFSENTDYKGYSTSMKIGDNRDLFSGDNLGMAIRMFLTMSLIMDKHRDSRIRGNRVIVNSLIQKNLDRVQIKDVETTAVVLWDGASIVKATNKSFKVPVFDEQKVVSGFYDKEFSSPRKKYNGIVCGVNQDIVDAYGEGFKINQDEILISNSSRRLIGDGNTEQEFIGSASRLRLQSYFEVRKQLAKHIWTKMKADLTSFGDTEGLEKWYKERLMERMPIIIDYCTEALNLTDGKKGSAEFGDVEVQTNSPSETFALKEHPFTIHVSPKKCFWCKLSLSNYKDNGYICPLTGHAASIFFHFEFSNYIQVQKFLGCELPKFCVGWRENRYYNGNPILDVTDPIGNMRHPLGENNSLFDFSIGLSKTVINNHKKKKEAENK